MKTNRGKLRNITTGVLHTCMEDIYVFFEEYTGIGMFTHELPTARELLLPYLKQKIGQSWFKEKLNPIKENNYSIIIPDLAPEEREEYFEKFKEIRNILFNRLNDEKDTEEKS